MQGRLPGDAKPALPAIDADTIFLSPSGTTAFLPLSAPPFPARRHSAIHLLHRPGELRRGQQRPGDVRRAGRPVQRYQRERVGEQFWMDQCGYGDADKLLRLLHECRLVSGWESLLGRRAGISVRGWKLAKVAGFATSRMPARRYLVGNQLSGTIPTSLGSLTGLGRLCASHALSPCVLA